jgi:hypothetical protein
MRGDTLSAAHQSGAFRNGKPGPLAGEDEVRMVPR